MKSNPLPTLFYRLLLELWKFDFCAERLLEAASIEEGFFFIFGFAFDASESELGWKLNFGVWTLFSLFWNQFDLVSLLLGCVWFEGWDQVKRKDKIESLLFFKKKKMSKKMGLVRIGSKKRQGDIKRSKPRCRNSK